MDTNGIRKEIYKSLPKEVMVDGELLAVRVEYADRARVNELLKETSVAVTIEFSTTERWEERSPPNNVLKAEVMDTGDIKYTKGERVKSIVTINVHTTNRTDQKYPPDKLIMAYIDRLLIWSIRDLGRMVERISKDKIKDIEYAHDGTAKRKYTVEIGYPIVYEEEIVTIDTVNATVNNHPMTWEIVESQSL